MQLLSDKFYYYKDLYNFSMYRKDFKKKEEPIALKNIKPVQIA
jgi:hypothetical protein